MAFDDESRLRPKPEGQESAGDRIQRRHAECEALTTTMLSPKVTVLAADMLRSNGYEITDDVFANLHDALRGAILSWLCGGGNQFD